MAHERRDSHRIDASKDCRRSKRMPGQIAAQIVGKFELFLQSLDWQANSVACPWSLSTIKKHMLWGVAVGTVPQHTHQPLHGLGQINHARLVRLVDGLVLRQYPSI